jgi:hypothetical protein
MISPSGNKTEFFNYVKHVPIDQAIFLSIKEQIQATDTLKRYGAYVKYLTAFQRFAVIIKEEMDLKNAPYDAWVQYYDRFLKS